MPSAINSCIEARIEVSGVRSSWLTIDTNCDFSPSSAREAVTSVPMAITNAASPSRLRSGATAHSIMRGVPA